jgi:hypothetical protein
MIGPNVAEIEADIRTIGEGLVEQIVWMRNAL